MNLNDMAETTDNKLVNRVAASGLKTIKLEAFIPQVELFEFDIREFLFKGLLLREKEFRQSMKEFDWSAADGKVLCVHCSSDAIIPKWAFMLITMHAWPVASDIYFGNAEGYRSSSLVSALQGVDWSAYKDQRVILKGCSEGYQIPEEAYIVATQGLLPHARSIMYGEPCSTVPVYKKPKDAK